MYKRALISVSDKSGLLGLAQKLHEQGTKIVSTGGTYNFLKENHIPVTAVSEQTGYPEVMDGRVRTLHPRIHMSLLARRDNTQDMALLKKEGLEPFDLVVVNLYPFEQKKDAVTFEEVIEFIDIGGPTLLRAAAKNFASIAVISDPSDYSRAMSAPLSLEDRKRLAAKVFARVSSYDSLIAKTLDPEWHQHWSLGGELVQELRYGENPQQTASWYRTESEGLHQAKILQGKPLSYNNILDLEAAISLVKDFTLPCVAGVKHNNACGVASSSHQEGLIQKMLKADPVSVFGGIVALNYKLGQREAEILSPIFLECVVAPHVTEEAKHIFSNKKNLRVLEWPALLDFPPSSQEVRTISGGFLLQTTDQVSDWSETWTTLGEKPSSEIRAELEFAWKVCRHLKSNAIAITAQHQTLGLGMGQVNRVEAVQIAIQRMKQHHPHAKITVLASDAFFPFSDSMDLIHQAGIKWVIQPGGSVRDEEVFARAAELGINMVLTGVRHFRH